MPPYSSVDDTKPEHSWIPFYRELAEETAGTFGEGQGIDA